MSDWSELRRLTAARIGLERAGASLATRPLLDFRLAHARARDAVHAELDTGSLLACLPERAILVDSQAPDRRTYLMRPDLGRALDPASGARLAADAVACDLAIVLADGLSAVAVARHGPPTLAALLPRLSGWRRAPLVVARHARVALGDRVAEALGAACVLMLIGERPGLSAPDSLGAYLTWAPAAGTTDADRNCVSNIRPEGLGHEEAAFRLAFLLERMRELRRSGVALKDESEAALLTGDGGS